MAATYTFDIFSTLDGYGSYGPAGDWGGYWGKQGPELLDHRLGLYSPEQRMVFGANTYRQFAQMLVASTDDSDVRDSNVQPAGHRGVDDPGGASRLAERDGRER
jgi:hypothetical protein